MKLPGVEGEWELESVSNGRLTSGHGTATSWRIYRSVESPKSEDDLRKEFAEKWSMGSNPFISEIEIAQKRANLLFDTFELKKK